MSQFLAGRPHALQSANKAVNFVALTSSSLSAGQTIVIVDHVRSVSYQLDHRHEHARLLLDRPVSRRANASR